jgi:transcriptional regulator with XRE-family HTH domain
MPEGFDERLGAALRRRRAERGLTLVQVAERTGLSHPFISQVERGLARPSMDSLQRLADALGTTPFALLEDGAEPGIVTVVRAADRARLDPSARHVGGELRPIPLGTPRLHAFEVLDPPAAWGEWYQHDGDEAVFVLDGTIELDVDGRVERLGPGDTICYPGKVPHRTRSVDGPVRILYVASG